MSAYWGDDDYRGWYVLDNLIRWKCGLPRLMPEEWINAFYYHSTDNDVDWDETPIDWGDTYDIDADDRKEEAELRAEERRLWRPY